MTTKKRKKMEKLIYDTFDELDKSGINTKKYRDELSVMTDKEFDKYFNDFFNDPNAYLILDIVDYEHTLMLEDIEDAADILKIELFEYVAMPHITMDKTNVVWTKEKVPVGYIHVKRTQQTVLKKTGISTNISKRSALTNQVSGEDKNGRESDLENTMLISIGCLNCAKELNGPRSDDMAAKQIMNSKIATQGYFSLSDLPDELENKTTLVTVDTFFYGMGLDSDLVTKGLLLSSNLE